MSGFLWTRPKNVYSTLSHARETQLRWLSKRIVGLFWGTHFQHGGKFVPYNSPTIHFDNGLDPVSCATSKLRKLSPKFSPDFSELEVED